jgi:hypothetical protein
MREVINDNLTACAGRAENGGAGKSLLKKAKQNLAADERR